MALDDQITMAQLTLQQLSLQRQLKQIRDQRREANEQYRQLAQYSEGRMAKAAKRCRVLLHGMCNLSAYLSVVGALYPCNPGGYVLRKHARLLMYVRSQCILENYNRLKEHHYGTIIGVLEETVQDLRMEVQELRNRREETVYLLQEQVVVLAISRIKSYYQEKKNDTSNVKNVRQRSLLEQVVSRKANERLLTTCRDSLPPPRTSGGIGDIKDQIILPRKEERHEQRKECTPKVTT